MIFVFLALNIFILSVLLTGLGIPKIAIRIRGKNKFLVLDIELSIIRLVS